MGTGQWLSGTKSIPASHPWFSCIQNPTAAGTRALCSLRNSPGKWEGPGGSLRGPSQSLWELIWVQLLSPWDQTGFTRECRKAQLAFPSHPHSWIQPSHTQGAFQAAGCECSLLLAEREVPAQWRGATDFLTECAFYFGTDLHLQLLFWCWLFPRLLTRSLFPSQLLHAQGEMILTGSSKVMPGIILLPVMSAGFIFGVAAQAEQGQDTKMQRRTQCMPKCSFTGKLLSFRELSGTRVINHNCVQS